MIVMKSTVPWRPKRRDHLGPQLAADFVFAQQRAAERDHRLIFLGQPVNGPVVLHDVDHGLLEALAQARGLVRGPLVLLIDVARRDQHRELKLARTNRTVLAGRYPDTAPARAVYGHVRGARAPA